MLLCFEVPQKFMFLKVVYTLLSTSQSDKNIKTIRARRVCGCCAVTMWKKDFGVWTVSFHQTRVQQLDIDMF